jgi:hypothetical protein
VDFKRNPGIPFLEVGFESYPVNELYKAYWDKQPTFHWNASIPGVVNVWCPVWFPGAVVGGVLLGWGLLCRKQEE